MKREKGIVSVGKKELLKLSFKELVGGQAVLICLKKMGLPVIGVEILELDPKYRWTIHKNTSSYIYEWELI